MRSTVAFVLGIGAIGALVECSPFGGGDFTCEGDQSCTGGTDGRCEPSGFCSFSDPACGLDGRSWGDGPNAGQCIAGGGPVDASTPVDQTVMIDAAVLIDSSIDAAPVPYCAGTFIKVCLPSKPSIDTSLPAILDTGSSSACRNDATDMAGMPLTGFCVIAGANVTANSAVLGSKPLIVIATNKLSFNVLDVASHRGMGNGPGADFAGCAMGIGADGTAGGGGGGGAFGGAGGKGGDHDVNKGGAGGKKAPADKLRGGCPGGNGSTAAKFGHGGGAVMLVAAGTIEIDGVLNASGSGADAAGNTKEFGGSGGGSGGMIVLEAMQITNNGFVIANGGGGASGSGSGTSPSVAGSDPSPASTTGGGGGKETAQNGGDGGDGGGTGKPDGSDGIDGALFNMMTGGAGGGGGGVGAILTHGSTLSGNVSPAATTF